MAGPRHLRPDFVRPATTLSPQGRLASRALVYPELFSRPEHRRGSIARSHQHSKCSCSTRAMNLQHVQRDVLVSTGRNASNSISTYFPSVTCFRRDPREALEIRAHRRWKPARRSWELCPPVRAPKTLPIDLAKALLGCVRVMRTLLCSLIYNDIHPRVGGSVVCGGRPGV